jgi:2-polyprenyl-3-methyl-5-hydroxy-6-metoxy-1,4-benzoquinol methylase
MSIEWEAASCIFCGPGTPKRVVLRAPDRMNGMPGHFTLAQCDRCGLAFQDPRPTESTIKLAYPDSYHVYEPPSHGARPARWKQLVSDLVLANYYGYRHLAPNHWLLKSALLPFYAFKFRPRSVPVYKPHGRLLEIGCTWGGRLESERARGWSVIGVDFNEKAIQWGRSHLGLDLRLGSIFEMDFPDATFDTIIFDMVLEHVHRPEELFARIDRWLKPGGEVLFSIPYFEGMEFKLFKQYAYGLQLPTHLYFFNKTHVRTLLSRYEDIEFRFQHAEKDLIAPIGYIAGERGPGLLRIARSRLLRHGVFKPLAIGLSLLGRSSRVTVKACKPDPAPVHAS